MTKMRIFFSGDSPHAEVEQILGEKADVMFTFFNFYDKASTNPKITTKRFERFEAVFKARKKGKKHGTKNKS